MSTHNICFRGEIRKISVLLVKKCTLSGAMALFSVSVAVVIGVLTVTTPLG